jgi:phosphate transport system ATP-binding protein
VTDERLDPMDDWYFAEPSDERNGNGGRRHVAQSVYAGGIAAGLADTVEVAPPAFITGSPTYTDAPAGNANGAVAPLEKLPFRRDAPLAELDGASAELVAEHISAWFGSNKVLEDVSLRMRANTVTALIGPSGCGKSTFLRILNRMHELVPSAALAGRVLLDGADIYDAGQRPTDTRRKIGMVFQKPNPFPAMSVADNVLAGLKLTHTRVGDRQALVEECLRRAGLWNEVRNRLGDPGGSLSGGQQQRLCIARALAIRPLVLLMDEPCSALDPTSTRRIEETIEEISHAVTIVIVTHNMQQAQRVSHRCAFFLAGEEQPGRIVEEGPTEKIFNEPEDAQTADYVHGRFG